MQFSKSHLSPLMKLKITYHDARCRLYFMKKRWNYYIARTCQKLKTKTLFQFKPNEKYKYKLTDGALLFHWSFYKVQERYLKKSSSDTQITAN